MSGECDCCGFINPVGGTRICKAIKLGSNDEFELCQACTATQAGSEMDYATSNGPVLRAIAWGINRIRRDLQPGGHET